MLDPILVESATIYPHKCAVCGVSKAPFLDWHVEIPSWGRLYTCAYCDKAAAVIRGYVDGVKADEIAAAGSLLEAKEREVASLVEQLGNMSIELGILEHSVAERDTTIEKLEARIAQMSTSIRESAEAVSVAVALVGAEDESPDE